MKVEVTRCRSIHGYDIPVRMVWEGQQKVLLVCHGFGSSTGSLMVEALAETLPPQGIGVVAFDFPAHGESPAGAESLRIPSCLDDIAAVEQDILRRKPDARLSYFGSSFGAYCLLLYLSERPHEGRTAVLRSSAVAMPELIRKWVDERAETDLDEKGYFVPDYDYQREMRITRAFLEDLRKYDVFSRKWGEGTSLRMVHGEKDDVASVDEARRFAALSGAELRVFPEGDHHLMGPGELEQVLELAIEWLEEKNTDE